MTQVVERRWVDEDVAAVVRVGLGGPVKRLPPWLLYDATGSRLFERITTLPSYYLTRTERAILTEHADAIVDAAGAPRDVVELGAGTATKSQILLAALAARHPRVRFFPVDVSAAPLAATFVRLGRELPTVTVSPVLARQEGALALLATEPAARLVLFLGSSIGNLERAEATALLAAARAAVGPEGALVLGTDLCRDPAVLVPAYADPEGVTAAFNRNVLARLNRELDADFDPEAFEHVVLWNEAESRVELYLESRRAQRACIPYLGMDVCFAAGERIHTESSAKYTLADVDTMLGGAGLARVQTWTDADGRVGVHVAR